MHVPEQIQTQAIFTANVLMYSPDSVDSKTITGRLIGPIMVKAFTKGESTRESVSVSDSLVQVIEGKAEVIISGKVIPLQSGQSIIIPANHVNRIRANGRFELLQTAVAVLQPLLFPEYMPKLTGINSVSAL
jgi:hypothetical protein